MARLSPTGLAVGLLTVFLGLSPKPAVAQQQNPPVPTETPTAPPAKAGPGKSPITPGFEESTEDAEDEEDQAPIKKRKYPRGRDDGRRPQEEGGDISVSAPGPNEQLIADMNATRGEITLGELVDEILADVVAELDRRAPSKISPMAIREITLGKNVAPSYARILKSALVAQIQTGTRILMVDCLECEATRTQLENGQWTVTRGITSTQELKEIGDRIGAKSFMKVRFSFDPESGSVIMTFELVRASDSTIVWSETFRADDSTPMLLRSSEAPIRRKDRLRDLEMLLEGRPYYGIAASAGFMLIPYDDPIDGDVTGATAGFRIYERFGSERSLMFGLDVMGFLNTSRLAGAILSAGLWWIPLHPDLVNPEIRLGSKAGAFVAGSEGNAAVFQLGGELLLRYRFGLYAYALFMTKSPFNGNDLGGLGFNTGLSWNW